MFLARTSCCFGILTKKKLKLEQLSGRAICGFGAVEDDNKAR